MIATWRHFCGAQRQHSSDLASFLWCSEATFKRPGVIFVLLRGNIQATWRHFCGAQRQESASDEFIMIQDQRIKFAMEKMQKVFLFQKIFRLRRANYMAFLLKILLFFNEKNRNFEKNCAALGRRYPIFIYLKFQIPGDCTIGGSSQKIAPKVVF